MNQKAALGFGALAGAVAALLFGRRRPRELAGAAPPARRGGDDLRRKLDEARRADVDESEFNAAGMAAETIVAEEPSESPPPNEFEAMRQRVHEEARAAAEEMRRRAETDA